MCVYVSYNLAVGGYDIFYYIQCMYMHIHMYSMCVCVLLETACQWDFKFDPFLLSFVLLVFVSAKNNCFFFSGVGCFKPQEQNS